MMNLQLFGGRGSGGGNSPQGRTQMKAFKPLSERLERVREKSEQSRIVREATAEKASGTRNWNPKQGDRAVNVSYERAQNEIYNAPIGTVITMEKHSTGDYVGEYTKTAEGWVGSQQYRSSFKKPGTVKTSKGFAMAVSGNDIKVLKSGGKKR